MSIVTIADVTKKLQAHAEGTRDADDPKNLADYIWLLKHQGVAAEPDAVWSDLCQEFDKLNVALNADPSESITRQLAYAVNGLLALCLDVAVSAKMNEEPRQQLLGLAWRINTAWDAVLAGDIESIAEHVALEESARAIR